MFRCLPTVRPLLAGIICIAMLGCAAPAPPPVALEMPVFPAPPDPPRIVYERTLVSSADVEVESRESAFERLITGAQRSGIGLGKPFGVTVHRGRVFVSDTLRRQVLGFDVAAQRFLEIGNEGQGELRKPMGLDTDDRGNLYVCDASLKQVLVYDRDGRYLRRLGRPELYDRPAGLTVDADGGRVYVVDTGGVMSKRHRVVVLDGRTGAELFTISKRGSDEGELNLPRDATLDAEGNLYVVDGGNFRVQVFTADGRYLRSFGAVGRQGGQFSRPKGVGVDGDGNVYVADTAFGNFQIFDRDGRLLLAVGNRHSAPGPARFMLPAGLAVDEDGRIYLVDQYFRKVDVFRPVSLAADQGWLVPRVETAQ